MTLDASRRKAVRDTIDAGLPAMTAALAEAIAVPSVNPKYPGQRYEEVVGAEGEVSSLMGDLYRHAGAEVEMVEVEHGRANACGRIKGTGGGRSLLFNGHVDVVPAVARDRWAVDPFRGLVTDDEVVGRGATDMKGGLIAHAFAMKALRECGIPLKGDVVLQSVVGEEVGDHHAGTTAAVEAGYRADAAVVCEPTNHGDGPPMVSPTAPGTLWCAVVVEGLTAHAGFRGLTVHPALRGQRLGVNVPDKLWLIYQAMRQLEDEWAYRDRHPLFAPGTFHLLPGVMRSNPEGIDIPFLLADTGRIEYCAIYHPDRSAAEVREEIERTVRRACDADPWLREHPARLEWRLEWPSYDLDRSAPILPAMLDAHAEALGRPENSTTPTQNGFFGVCDVTWLQQQGIPAVIYGPGVAERAHTENESVPHHQLRTAATAYAFLAMSFCGVEDA